MPRPPSRPTRLTAEERRLLKEQEDLKRREAELERQLRTIPARIEQRKQLERERTRIQAQIAAPAISLKGRNARSSRNDGRPRGLPGRELQNAKAKFLVLCLILATLMILLWRSIPS